MVAPNTGSILTTADGRNQTRTAVSTNIIIEVDGNAVGAVKQLSINEARNVATIDEVGTDGHIDSVPQKSTDITGSCQRTRFDNLRIATAFSRGFIHAAAQRVPFDILIKDIFASNDPSAQLVTTIKNVWITKIAVTFRADDFVIVEDLDWTAETIFTTLGNNSNINATAGVGISGGRGITIIDDFPTEKEADRGGSRGALSAAGLLLAIDQVVA
jgi:hypothetical protein